MDATLLALGGILLKAVPTFLLVILLNFYLKAMFFKPLEKVLRECVDHDNAKRPHRGLILRVPRNEGAEPVVFASTAQLRYGTGQGVLSAAVCKRGPLPSAMSASRRDRRMCQAKQRRQAGQPGAGIGTAAVVPQGSIDSCR